MNLQVKNPAIMLRVGFVCLAAGNLAHMLLHPTSKVSQDLLDGVTGCLLGIAIGCLLMGMFKSRHRA